jgi:hypothetical protein
MVPFREMRRLEELVWMEEDMFCYFEKTVFVN